MDRRKDSHAAATAESADFMASYAFWDRNSNRFVLGPPVGLQTP